MPHAIAEATSGRAKCRGCKQAIQKGELRLGEAVPNPFGDGEAVHWYHLACGARLRAEPFLEAVSELEGDTASEKKDTLPGDEVLGPLKELAELGKTYYRLQRFVGVQVAPSGRARCQGCREMIEKGALRFVLQRIEDGMASGAGFVHVGCAHSYAGAVDGMVPRVRDAAELSSEQWAEVESALEAQSKLEREVKIPYAQRS